ncbi:MAG: hypothetical protein NT004_10955 [Bacteroidetes bacterium]|nr:hypothetical protein [Bacteroidota bacterium]
MNFKKQRKALVIVGMHRSGTSTTSGIFSILGFNLGTSVNPPLEDNPKGFFENIPLILLNNRLLESLGSSWHETFLIRKEWWLGNPLINFRNELVSIIEQQFFESDHLLIKDPRLSILLPFYLDVFKMLNIQPYFIICVRNPAEVAASLKRRNHFPTEKSFLLWMDYMLKAEFHTRNYLRSFIVFNELIQDPFSLLRDVSHGFHIDIQMSPILKTQILEFVEKDLKHHNFSGLPTEHSFISEITDLYKELTKGKDGKFICRNFEVIDNISTSFYNKMNFFQGLGSNVEASLVVVHSNGLKKEMVLPVVLGMNRLFFDITDCNEISAIIFTPSNCRLALLIQNIEITDQNNNTIELNEFFTGDDFYKARFKKHKTRELLFFHEEIPDITLNMNVITRKLNRLTFIIIYNAFGEGALKLTVDNERNLANTFYHEREIITERLRLKENKLNENEIALRQQEEKNQRQKDVILKLSEGMQKYQQIIITKDKCVQEIYDSKTWKTGKLILYPIIYFYQIILRLFSLKIQ